LNKDKTKQQGERNMSEISETFRKMALFGIGAIAISKEKIEEFAQEMVKKGELNKEEGKKFVMDVLSEKNRQCKELEEKINKKVRDVVENSGAATKKDVESLSTRMEKIEATIDRLKQI
jgi:polyhydroxyalkanoate synthesis regulator phasin